jgi:hypothetical protein
MFTYTRGSWVEFGRTEVVWNTPSPNWVKFFQAAYIFETDQRIRFQVADVDSESVKLTDHQFIGQCETDVQTLVTSRGTEVSLKLINSRRGDPRGALLINVEQSKTSGTVLAGVVTAFDLRKVHTFSRNCPFFVIAKPSESGRDLPVYRSEKKDKCSGATWPVFKVPVGPLCNGDFHVPMKVAFIDQHGDSEPVPIASVTMSVQSFLEKQGQRINLESDGKKKGFGGTLTFSRLELIRTPTFYDYLRGGLQLNLITAIDFTGSNGNVASPTSLHHISPGRLNQYETCIQAVGSVICPYDSDQMFAVYGFGGEHNDSVSHCLPLTFDPTQPCVHGIEGILGLYRNALRVIGLAGPTLFAPVIDAATRCALASWAGSRTYTVLLILTDGCINDMRDTIDGIVAATEAPLSIIIVGVGNANFDSMRQLDGDEGRLKSRSGVTAKRDIVQFVPFSDYAASPASLAAEVLAEIPAQVHAFCSANGIIPPPA